MECPIQFLTWPTMENLETEALRAAELNERFMAGYQGRALQSARSNGKQFAKEVLGAVFLPENQTHSGNNQADSLETTITGAAELSFKNKLENNGLNSETMYCENDLSETASNYPTAADVIDEVYMRSRCRITEQEAEEM